MKTKEYTLDLAGNTVTARFTDLADQANGSVILESGDTVVLATAVMSKHGRNNPGYFNLTVEYMEKHYAAGEILGSRFTRREGRPTDEAVLSGRVIDRTLRPLFAHHIKNAVQVIVTVLAVGDVDPGVLAVNAASLAVATSDIPWNGPVGCVHVGKYMKDGIESELKVDHYIPENGSDENGSYTLDLTVCGKGGTINMIEAGAHEVSEETMVAAFDLALEEITKIEAWQNEIVSQIGKEKIVIEKPELPEALVSLFQERIADRVDTEIFGDGGKSAIHTLVDEWLAIVEETYGEESNYHELKSLANAYYHDYVDEVVHREGIENDRRVDLRPMDQVRSLFAQAGGISPVLHGSGIFYRGETHVLSALTLGSPDDVHELDGMEVKGSKRFMHHYNFPPFSAGETGRVGGFNRRQIGHGALAEKALMPVLPNKTDFPYTIRLVSESMASNGSTSQASICGSSIALMDGGVPTTGHVAGIAMGLLLDQNGSGAYKILTDIQGPEDHHGDMDFKVAGTRKGITAIQLDIKVGGIPPKILAEALIGAKAAREQILDVMETEISTPRPDISSRAPKILVITIPVDKIGMVIGSGGKTIKEIHETTGAELTIEDDGTVYITGKEGAAEAGKAAVEMIVKEWTVGERAEGTVVKILDEIGAIVRISPYAEGLAHISELATFRVQKVSDILKVDQKVPVTVVQIDKERDRIGLSIKRDNPDFIKNPYQ